MKKIGTLLLLAGGITCLSQAQDDSPEVTSWILNEGEVGSYYQTGSSTPVSNGHDANVSLVQYSNDNVYINCSGIPSYPIGPYQDGNPSQAGDKEYLFRIPRNPQAETGTKTEPGLGQIGVLINGVPIYNYSDAMSYNNQGIWNRNAPFFENDGFDCSKGHPAPDMQATLNDGFYHHHQNPTTFSSSTNPSSNVCDDYPSTGLYELDSTAHSPLIGYSFDGFPIYGSFAYANADGTGEIVRMESSYQLRNITDRTTLADGTVLNSSQYGPAISETYPLGAYLEDFEFIEGSGHLDISNGRFCVTPEYPEGTYCYFATIDEEWNSAFPYFIGPEYYGVVAEDNFGTQGPGSSGSTNVTISETVTTYDPNTTVSFIDIKDQNMLVYPNPTSDHVNVFLQQDFQNIEAGVFDLTGRLVISFRDIEYGSNWINVDHLESGVYYLVLRYGSETVTEKLIIE